MRACSFGWMPFYLGCGYVKYDMGCMKLILAQNCYRGFVSLDVVSYYMYESDRGKLKMPLNFKMCI